MSDQIPKSDLSAAIVKHFDSLRDQIIEVPEWAGDDGLPARISCSPVTVQERCTLAKEPEDSYLVSVLVMKARDMQGNPVFTVADKPLLMNRASAAVIARVANRILNADLVSPDLVGEFSPPGSKTDPV